VFCRYDEWVKADRIIWPVDKGGTKRKPRKKLKVRIGLSWEQCWVGEEEVVQAEG